MYFVNSLKLQFNLSFKVKRTLFNPVYLMKLKVIFVCLFYRKKKSDNFGWKTFKSFNFIKIFQIESFSLFVFYFLSYKITILHFIGLSIYSGLDFF